MSSKRKTTFRAISLVVSAFLAVAVTAGPAEAAAKKPGSSTPISTIQDTCWGK